MWGGGWGYPLCEPAVAVEARVDVRRLGVEAGLGPLPVHHVHQALRDVGREQPAQAAGVLVGENVEVLEALQAVVGEPLVDEMLAALAEAGGVRPEHCAGGQGHRVGAVVRAEVRAEVGRVPAVDPVLRARVAAELRRGVDVPVARGQGDRDSHVPGVQEGVVMQLFALEDDCQAQRIGEDLRYDCGPVVEFAGPRGACPSFDLGPAFMAYLLFQIKNEK